MRIVRMLLGILLIVSGIYCIAGFFIPDEWTVSRSIMIHASSDKIYPYISDFKQWDKWSPWTSAKDASLRYTYSGPATGIDAKQAWTSDNMGTGWMQFTAADPQRGVSYTLFIDMKGMQSTLQGTIAFKPSEENTLVIWTDHGNSAKQFSKRWMSLLIKPMLGKEFDAGLAKLKTMVEASNGCQ